MALHARPLLISKFAMASVGDIAATIHHDERPPVKWPPSANVGIGGCASPQPIVRGRSHCTFGRTPTPFWRNLSGFPATRIDGELYWDGGILSNTPTEAVFDDDPRKDSLIFAVHLWNPSGAEPTTMAEVLNWHKDVQYSSRIASHITRQQQAHRLRHVINQLVARLPEAERTSEAVKELAGYGCSTQMKGRPEGVIAERASLVTALCTMALRAGGFATFVARVVGAVIGANEVKKIELLPFREEIGDMRRNEQMATHDAWVSLRKFQLRNVDIDDVCLTPVRDLSIAATKGGRFRPDRRDWLGATV